MKVAKKKGLINVPNLKNGEIDQQNEMRYEDWQTKYKMILMEFEAEKQKTTDLLALMNENQMRYIKREQEYKEVEKNIETNIDLKSTKPLDKVEHKTEEQYLLEGIDIHDSSQNQEILRKKKLQDENQKFT